MAAMESILQQEALEREFERKRSAFVFDYEIQDKPALIWQCMPLSNLRLDNALVKMRSALCDGGYARGQGWWYGFQANSSPTYIFDGLSAYRWSEKNDAGWITEAHVDGHILAGVWSFPQQSLDDSNSTVGANFFADAFDDFGVLVARLFQGLQYIGGLAVTCTMMHSDKLSFAVSNGSHVSPAVRRSILRWPSHQLADLSQLATCSRDMANQFLRAYGTSRR